MNYYPVFSKKKKIASERHCPEANFKDGHSGSIKKNAGLDVPFLASFSIHTFLLC